jgi:hypothetical protein
METEMESQLHGVSSGQHQLFAEIAQCHDWRALPEHEKHNPSGPPPILASVSA